MDGVFFYLAMGMRNPRQLKAVKQKKDGSTPILFTN